MASPLGVKYLYVSLLSAIHNALNSLCSGGVYAENGNKLLLQVDGDFIRADNNLVPTGTILQSRDIQNISLGGIAAPACREEDYRLYLLGGWMKTWITFSAMLQNEKKIDAKSKKIHSRARERRRHVNIAIMVHSI